MTISPISRSASTRAATNPASAGPAFATHTLISASASTPRTAARWKPSQLSPCSRPNISRPSTRSSDANTGPHARIASSTTAPWSAGR
jgi:hypothetical protein